MSFSNVVDPDVVRSLEGIAAIAFSALSAYSVRLINAHVNSKNLATANRIFSTSVKAAEQLGIGKIGAQKFDLARAAVIRAAARHGIPLTDAEIQTGIEAAVTDLKASGVALVSDAPPVAPTAAQAQAAAAAALRAAADQIDGSATPPVVPVTDTAVPTPAS